MQVPNVTAGQPITEAWGEAVADSVNALEAGQGALATDAELTAAVAAHAAPADPHAGYQKESEKAAASGYASLDVTGKVPAAQLPAVGVGLVQTGNVVIEGLA